MTKADLYTIKGEKSGSIELPEYFSLKPNMYLISQAVRVYQDRLHPGYAKIKTRSEVKASTRKIYRQKGTGKARHGAISAPIFVGGGIAHGPRGVKRTLSLSAAQKIGALQHTLSLKNKLGRMVVVTGLEDLKKTKDAAKFLLKVKDALGLGKKNVHFTFSLSDQNSTQAKYIRNIFNTKVGAHSDLNAYLVFNGGVLVIDEKVFSNIKHSETKSTKVYKKGTTKVVEKKKTEVAVVGKTKVKKERKALIVKKVKKAKKGNN